MDAVLLVAVSLLAVAACWQALLPLRASVAVASGDKLLGTGDGTGALRAYERATTLIGGEARYWDKLGRLYMTAERPEAAMRAYESGLAANAYDLTLLIEAAQVADGLGDAGAARRYADRALELAPGTPRAVLTAAEHQLKQGAVAQARAELEQAVQLLPADASLWVGLGEARRAAGDLQSAREAYERALELDPGSETAAQRLSELPTG